MSLLERVLTWLANMVCARPQLFAWPQLLMAVGAAAYTVFNLEFHTNRNDLVGANKKYHNTFLKFLNEFPLQDDLVVVAESEDLEKNRQFVARLGARLEQDPEHFRGVFYRRDLRTLGSKTLLMVSTEDLQRLQAELKEYQPFIRTFARATNLVSFVKQMNTRFRAAASGQATADRKTLERALPALQKIMQQARAAIQRPGPPPRSPPATRTWASSSCWPPWPPCHPKRLSPGESVACSIGSTITTPSVFSSRFELSGPGDWEPRMNTTSRITRACR